MDALADISIEMDHVLANAAGTHPDRARNGIALLQTAVAPPLDRQVTVEHDNDLGVAHLDLSEVALPMTPPFGAQPRPVPIFAATEQSPGCVFLLRVAAQAFQSSSLPGSRLTERYLLDCFPCVERSCPNTQQVRLELHDGMERIPSRPAIRRAPGKTRDPGVPEPPDRILHRQALAVRPRVLPPQAHDLPRPVTFSCHGRPHSLPSSGADSCDAKRASRKQTFRTAGSRQRILRFGYGTVHRQQTEEIAVLENDPNVGLQLGQKQPDTATSQ